MVGSAWNLGFARRVLWPHTIFVTLRCCIVWRGIVWYCMVVCCIVRCCVVFMLCGAVLYGVVLYGVVLTVLYCVVRIVQ